VVGCDIVNYDIWDISSIDVEKNNDGYKSITVYNEIDCMYWIYININYVSEEIEFFETPREVYYNRKSDCDGMSIFLMALLIKYNFEIPYLVLVDCNNNNSADHAVVLCNDIIYDCTLNTFWKKNEYPYNILNIYNIDQTVKILNENRPLLGKH
jgi:hypothetical protein